MSKKSGTLHKEAAVKRLGGKLPETVRFLSVEEFLAFVESLEAQAAGREATVRGYKVKSNFRATDNEEKGAKKKTLSQVILDSIKKMRK